MTTLIEEVEENKFSLQNLERNLREGDIIKYLRKGIEHYQSCEHHPGFDKSLRGAGL